MRSLSLCFGWWSLPLVASCCLPGCGGGHEELSKRLAAVQAELSQLHTHGSRLEERLQALEMREKAAAAALPGAVPSGSNVEHPRLMVVKLNPGDETHDAPSETPTASLQADDSAADAAPRPVIRVYGSRTDVGTGNDSPKRKR